MLFLFSKTCFKNIYIFSKEYLNRFFSPYRISKWHKDSLRHVLLKVIVRKNSVLLICWVEMCILILLYKKVSSGSVMLKITSFTTKLRAIQKHKRTIISNKIEKTYAGLVLIPSICDHVYRRWFIIIIPKYIILYS